MERTLYLRVAFDGTDFHGWQRQLGQRTVQEVLEDALRRVLRHPLDLAGSGRTDRGVHAIGHVGSLVTTSPIPCGKLLHAVGSRLPEDVGVLEVREVHADFHATRSAISKLYRYRIHHSVARPVKNLTQRYVYHCWRDLDVERMREAAQHFVGEHDFTAMTPLGAVRESMVRRVFQCAVSRAGEEIHIDVEGDGFLYHQVRNMAGTLIDVGRGRWAPEHVTAILASRDRRQAGPTAAAQGLCLQWVRYPEHLMRPPETMEPAGEAGVEAGSRAEGQS